MKNIFIAIRRTPFQSLTTFIVIFFTLLLTLCMVGGSMFVLGVLKKVESQPQVIAYFKPKTPEATILTVKNSLLRSDKIAQVDYIDQKEAFHIYRSRFVENELVGELLTPEIFPPSLTIQTKKPEYLQEIAQFLENQSQVEEVQFQQSTVKRLLTVTQSIRVAMISITLYLFIMTIMVLVTMIGFKIALRKDEFELLQLLGATRGHIRAPLQSETLFIAVLAATTSFVIYSLCVFGVHITLAGYLKALGAVQLGYQSIVMTVWPVSPFYFLIFGIFTYAYSYILCSIATYIAAQRFITKV